MKKYNVTGRIRADIEFEEIVEAKSEKSAIKIAEQSVYSKCGITVYDVIDDEIYCEKLREND